MRCLLGYIAPLLLIVPAYGQDDALVRSWLEQQEARFAEADSVVVVESYTLRLEGSFGERTRTHDRLKRLWPPPERPGLDRTPPPRRARNGLRDRRLPFNHIDAMLRHQLPRLDLVDAVVEQTQEQQAVRHTLRAAERRSPIQTATLWIDPSTLRLLRSAIDVRLPFQDEPMRVETTYQRTDGIDVPLTRTAEGNMRRKRRGRTFSQYVSFEARYSDVVLLPRP
ncbi:MAG: hypothetical protein AAF730_16540 [Bacteroidota bacterium]